MAKSSGKGGRAPHIDGPHQYRAKPPQMRPLHKPSSVERRFTAAVTKHLGGLPPRGGRSR
jgi:hypothetical protein